MKVSKLGYGVPDGVVFLATVGGIAAVYMRDELPLCRCRHNGGKRLQPVANYQHDIRLLCGQKVAKPNDRFCKRASCLLAGVISWVVHVNNMRVEPSPLHIAQRVPILREQVQAGNSDRKR